MNNHPGKSRIQLRWLAVGFILLIAAAGLVLYFNRAQAEYAQGMAAYAAFDYPSANRHFQQVTGFYKLASAANVSKAQQLTDDEIRPMLEAEARRGEGNYAAALEIYRKFTSSNPESAHGAAVNTYIADTNLEWGDSLVKAEDYPAAIEKYRSVPSESKNQAVDKQLAEAYLKWGDHLAQTGDYPGSIEKYRIVLKEYKDEPAAQAALNNRSAAYAGLGQQLIEKNSFLAAMDTYALANALNPDDTMRAKFESGYQAAFAALIDDTGKDGQRVLDEGLKLACHGQPAASGVLGLSNNQLASVQLCEDADGISLPEEWLAKTPGNFRFAVDVHSGTTRLDSCNYSGGYTLYRQQDFTEIKIFDVQTGKLLDHATYNGQAPKGCPAAFAFNSNSPFAGLTGDPVSDDAVQEAVTRMVTKVMLIPDESPAHYTFPGIPTVTYVLLPPVSGAQFATQDDVISVVFAPDGKQLASTSINGTQLWDVNNGAQVRKLSSAHTIAFSTDGRWMATGDLSEGTASVWEVASGANALTVKSYNGTLAISPDGNLLATLGESGATLWNLPGGSAGTKLEDYSEGGILSLTFSPDGKRLASTTTNGTLLWWDVTSGTLVRKPGNTSAVAFSPNGQWLASGSNDGSITLWDVATGNEVRTLNGHTDKVLCVAFSPDGLLLASGSADNTVKLWNPGEGTEIFTLDFHETRDDTGGTFISMTNAVESIAFSPDGKSIATGRASRWVDPRLNVLNLWEIESIVAP